MVCEGLYNLLSALSYNITAAIKRYLYSAKLTLCSDTSPEPLKYSVSSTLENMPALSLYPIVQLAPTNPSGLRRDITSCPQTSQTPPMF